MNSILINQYAIASSNRKKIYLETFLMYLASSPHLLADVEDDYINHR